MRADPYPGAVHHSVATHLGGRSYQQDRAFASPAHGLYVVIDGMGGEGLVKDAGGIVASVAVGHAEATTQADGFTGDVRQLLWGMHDRILTGEKRVRTGGGAAATVLALGAHGTGVGWVGDCTLVRIRGGIGQLRTLPHNVAGASVFVKGWTAQAEDVYRRDGRRHYLTEALGSVRHPPTPAHATMSRAQRGDVYILMSDGAFDPLGTAEITRLFADPSADAYTLLAAVPDDPDSDNATAIVVRILS